jgi:hypothetical protein
MEIRQRWIWVQGRRPESLLLRLLPKSDPMQFELLYPQAAAKVEDNYLKADLGALVDGTMDRQPGQRLTGHAAKICRCKCHSNGFGNT